MYSAQTNMFQVRSSTLFVFIFLTCLARKGMQMMDKVLGYMLEMMEHSLFELLSRIARPNIFPLSGNKALAEFVCEQDVVKTMVVKDIYLEEYTVTCKRWSLAKQMISPEALMVRDLWVLLK